MPATKPRHARSDTVAQLIGAAFGDAAGVSPAPGLLGTGSPTGTSSRRKKLWELPAQRQCSLIGTGLPVAEMRKLAARAGFDAKDMSDYSLHAVVAGCCNERRERAQALAARVELLEARNAELARRTAGLARELDETQDGLAAAEAALEASLGVCEGVAAAGCGRACPAEAALAGRCVLCIGGRSGLVDGYRRLVENRGGRFAHHDGGQEESLHRIEAAVAAADAVVCQAGCLSHAACFRLKDACKKLGKPCVFVQSPGVGSFARGLAVLGGEVPASQQITLLAS